MRKTIFLFAIFTIINAQYIRADQGDTLWTRFYGGLQHDIGRDIKLTDDGGYIITGSTRSYNDHLTEDIYLIKTDSNGDIQWRRTFGENGSDDIGCSVITTNDGGYAIAGDGFSNLLKTNSSGGQRWSFQADDHRIIMRSGIQLTNGNYVVAGYIWGSSSGRLFKLDSGGDKIDELYIGDSLTCVIKDSDSTFVVTGCNRYTEWGRVYNYGHIFKYDTSGHRLWRYTSMYDQYYYAFFYSASQTSDGGYIISGAHGRDGNKSMLITKTDSSGNAEWFSICGGTDDDRAYSSIQTMDGGYVVVGYTESFGAGNKDAYILKLDQNGDTLWTRVYGGSNNDVAYAVKETADRNYIVAGKSASFSQYSCYDVWLMKIEGFSPVSVQIIPDETPVKVLIGESFTYTGKLINLTDTIITCDFWKVLRAQDTVQYEPTLIFSDQQLNAHDTIIVDGLVQEIPVDFPLGESKMIFCWGNFPNDLMGTTTLTFEVVLPLHIDISYGIPSPVYIYAGDSIEHDCMIQNNTHESLREDIWTKLFLPTEEFTPPLQIFRDVLIEPDNPIHETGLILNIPLDAAGGWYSYIAYIGSLPDIIQDSSFIRFHVTEALLNVETNPIDLQDSIQAGGSFRYQGILENNNDIPREIDLWINIGLPGGSMYGPIMMDSIYLNAHGRISEIVVQEIPLNAQRGEYTYNAYCGDYPDIKIDSVSFAFRIYQPNFIDTLDVVWKAPSWFVSDQDILPEDFTLQTNYPNPFNSRTTIIFNLSKAEDVKLNIYNLRGQKVETLVDDNLNQGRHSIIWNAPYYSSGIYFCKLTTRDKALTKRMILLK